MLDFLFSFGKLLFDLAHGAFVRSAHTEDIETHPMNMEDAHNDQEPIAPAPEPIAAIVPATPVPPQFEWDTPRKAWHSTRVKCDAAGLTFRQKNILCACVFQESRFLTNPKPNQNKDPKTGAVWSTDYGIVQINDHYHIGPGKEFPSVQYVIENPGADIDWMIGIMKSTGELKPWSSYEWTDASGVVHHPYTQWLPLTSPMWQLAEK